MTSGSGVKIVLTASGTEMSDYFNNPFVAFVAGFAKGPVPSWLLRKMIYPPVERDAYGRAKYAPYGLRKVEALLLKNGFTESDVAVVHPTNLDVFIGGVKISPRQDIHCCTEHKQKLITPFGGAVENKTCNNLKHTNSNKKNGYPADSTTNPYVHQIHRCREPV